MLMCDVCIYISCVGVCASVPQYVVLYISVIGVGSNVVRSTSKGNARASIARTDNRDSTTSFRT